MNRLNIVDYTGVLRHLEICAWRLTAPSSSQKNADTGGGERLMTLEWTDDSEDWVVGGVRHI